MTEVAAETPTPPPTAVLSAILRRFRTRRALTLGAAARKMDVSFAALESYERGRRVPRPPALMLIFEHYGLTDAERYELLCAITATRPTAYRWVEALIDVGSSQELILNTLAGYARLGGGLPSHRDAVPVPPRKFPGR